MGSLAECLVEESALSIRYRDVADMDVPEDRLRQGSSSLQVVTGMYGSGRTSWLDRSINGLIRAGVDQRLILSVDLADSRIRRRASHALLLEVMDAYREKVPEIRQGISYLFFDNIDTVEDWAPFLKTIMRTYSVHIFATGASKEWLSDGILQDERLPIFVKELLPLFDHEIALRFWTCFRDDIPRDWKRILFGDKRSFQQMGLSALAFDVLRKDPDLSYRLCQQVCACLFPLSGEKVSVVGLVEKLKESGISTTRSSVKRILDGLESNLLVHSLEDYRFRGRKDSRASRAIIANDAGLVWGYASQGSQSMKNIISALVYRELRRSGFHGNVYTYRTKRGRLIDFVYTGPKEDSVEGLILISSEPIKQLGSSRVSGPLKDAMVELGAHRALLLNPNVNDEMEVEGGKIVAMSFDLWFSVDAEKER